MKNNSLSIKLSCYFAYVSQGIVVNFLPLLFVYFNENYQVDLEILGVIAVFSFVIQLTMDITSQLYVKKLGYKITGIICSLLMIFGLLFLAIFPFFMPIVPALFISTFLYSAGGGLFEDIISPIIENVPSKRKAFDMGIAHSMYSLGSVLAITISFAFLLGLGLEKWWILSLFFIIFPLIALIMFIFNKFPKVAEKSVSKDTNKPFYKSWIFYIILLLMLAAGSTELGISTWASTFAEIGLNVEKPFGDLYGAGLFALTMGLTRFIYAVFSQKIRLKTLLIISGFVALFGYLLAAFSPLPALSFVGIILVGAGVAAMWPGTITLTSKYFVNSSSAYYFLASAGDIGCSSGAYFLGLICSKSNINSAIGVGSIFPAIFIISILILVIFDKKKSEN